MLDSFRSRLVLSFLLITLVGMIIVVSAFLYVLAQHSIAVKKAGYARQSQLVANEIYNLYKRGASITDLGREVDIASASLGARIVVVGHNNQPIVDSASKTPFYTGSWTRLSRRALQRSHGAVIALSRPNLVLFQSPIRGVHQARSGAVYLVANVSEVLPAPETLIGVGLAATGTALLVWLLITIYFALSVSRPLLGITHATGRMAQGDYNVRVHVTGPREIERLASSFNGMAQQVQQSNQVLKDFLANVSHDLRTPLTMIIGFSQALLDGTARPSEVGESAMVINEEAGKMQRLVDDLLQLTRLESGLMKLERHPTEVRPMVQAILDRVVQARAGQHIASLQNLVPADLPRIDVDAIQMERALRNLLDNALQYTPNDGTVTVRAKAIDRAWVEMSVSDTGAGIPTDDLPRIFERFYRSDKSRGRFQGHSGLGLAIVREIVEAHGGRVSAESRPLSGTTFRFTVPVAPGMTTRPHEVTTPGPVREPMTQ